MELDILVAVLELTLYLFISVADFLVEYTSIIN